MKEIKHRNVWVPAIVGLLAFGLGILIGNLMTFPDREKTKATIASIEASAKNRIEEERNKATNEVISIERSLKANAEKVQTEYADKIKTADAAIAEVVRLKNERDSAINELNRMRQQYIDMSNTKEEQLNTNPGKEDDYEFQEVSFKINPRFILQDDLGMGKWVYRSYIISDKKTRRKSVGIMLEIEIITSLITLPPIGLDIEVLSGGNKIIGTGMLVPIEYKIGEKNRYKGVVIVESFSNIDAIRILRM
jgi:hypothetical protein